MESSRSSAARRLFQALTSSAIQRCRTSGTVCRLTVSLKCSHNSISPSVRISVSDTGVGSNLAEFRDLDYQNLAVPAEKWDGMITVTTTSIRDKDVSRYCLNLREPLVSRKRLKRLAPTNKSVGTFSGTQVSLLTAEEENIDDFVKWVVCFVQKIRILKIPDVAFELLVEHIDNAGTRCEYLIQEVNDFSLSLSMSNIDRLVSGLEDHVLKNRSTEVCHSCVNIRESLKFGIGQASRLGNNRGLKQAVEVVVVITPMALCLCCGKMNHLTTQVMYFQDFTPCPIPQSSLKTLTSIDWQSYGLRLKGNSLDEDGHAVLEWENLQSFAHIDIALHSYHERVLAMGQRAPSDRNIVMKALKFAMENLKEKYAEDFLSSNALQILDFAPGLSKTFAGLIFSSNDLGFQGDCVALLGLQSGDVITKEKVESVIHDKIIKTIELNDGKQKKKRDTTTCLFECVSLSEEERQEEEDGGVDDTSILDF